MQTILILGRQPALGLAELESLYGSEKVEPYSSNAAFLDLPVNNVDFSRLGGSIRLCKTLTPLLDNWQGIKEYLLKKTPEHAAMLPEGKLTIGLSVLGISVHIKELERTLLEMKKLIKKSGRPVRIVPNKQLELNAAQVLHNKLTEPGNWELVIVSDGKTAYLAQTSAIQDIDKYAARDQARPMRDTRVGMLPPKLAQIIINLAVGKLRDRGSEIEDRRSTKLLRSPVSDLRSPLRILDPFCGTGVILQEANLIGYDSYGTDLEPRMVDYSRKNLEWLDKNFQFSIFNFQTGKLNQSLNLATNWI